jgi:Na+/proline symporter
MGYGYLIAGILWLMWIFRIEILIMLVLAGIWHVLVTWPWECAAVAAIVTGLFSWSLWPEQPASPSPASVNRREPPPCQKSGLGALIDDGWRTHPQPAPLSKEQQRHIKRLQAAARRAER